MNYTNKLNIIASLIFVAIIAITAFSFASQAMAWAGGTDDGQGGCCGPAESLVSGGSNNYTPPPSLVENTPDPAAKCISFSADRTTVPYNGGTVNLSWSTQDASSVSISGIGSGLSANGSRSVTVNSNTTFTLTAIGAGGNDSHCQVSITVTPAVPASCVSFTSDRTTVPYGGGSVTLSWSTNNASSVSINNGVGNVTPVSSGSKTVNVTSNTTFTLTAVGAGGNDSHCQVTITVNPPKAVTCEYLNVSKSVISRNGENITLSWNTNNASSVSINNGIGNVAASGTKTVFANGATTYILTATGAGGSDTCAVSITTEPPVNVKTPSCNYLRADTDDFEEFGDEITLSWSTTNADEVSISRLGRVPSSGSEDVAIHDERTTFTLTARNLQHNTESTCTVTVRVDEEEEDDEPKPKCELEVSKTRVNKGDRVTLSWETSNADEIRIRDDRGNTIFDTRDYSSSQRKRYLDGEIDVVINRSTEFTLNAYGDGGNRSCEVEVKTDDLTVYENRDQGYVIALTQVPYTGFEAGPFLTFLFYAVLTLWALFIAYVLVIKKSSILGFSLYGNGGHSVANEADIANRKKVEALVAKYSGQNQN